MLPTLTVNVSVVMVDASILSLNVAVMALLMATSVAPLTGFVEITVGGVVSGAGAAWAIRSKINSKQRR